MNGFFQICLDIQIIELMPDDMNIDQVELAVDEQTNPQSPLYCTHLNLMLALVLLSWTLFGLTLWALYLE